MADAVQTHAALQAQALQVAPHAFGPMSRIPTQVPMADEPLTLNAHCFTCKGKSEFDAEGDGKKMKNGALHHQGKCKKCGQTLSAFVSGVKDAA
jgi:hypothetical protein